VLIDSHAQPPIYKSCPNYRNTEHFLNAVLYIANKSLILTMNTGLPTLTMARNHTGG
jgi:hypothetical protein